MVATKAGVLLALQQHETQLKVLGVRRYGLFGSFLYDRPAPDSDVDLLVEFEPGAKTFMNFSNLIFLLEEVLQRPVEVVTAESLSPYIGPRILREVEYVSIDA